MKSPLLRLMAFISAMAFSVLLSAQAPDLEAVKQDLQNYFSPAHYSVEGLDVKSDGPIMLLSGTVKFMNNDGVSLEIGFDKEAKKLSSLEAQFPASATFNLITISRVSDGKFGALIPASVKRAANTNIESVKLEFQGSKVTGGEINLALNEWDAVGFGSFKMTAVKIQLRSAQNQMDGTLTGLAQLGSSAITLSTNLTEDKELTLEGGIEGNLTFRQAVEKIAGPQEGGEFLNLIPGDGLKNAALTGARLKLIPTDKQVAVTGTSTLGAISMTFKAAGSKKKIHAELKAADLGQVVSVPFLNAFSFQSPLVVVSTQPDNSFTSEVEPSIKEAKVKKGFNVVSTVDLGSDYKKMFGKSNMNFAGTVEGPTRFSLKGSTPMDLDIGTSAVALKGIDFELASSKGVRGPHVGMSGMLTVAIPNQTNLDFTAKLFGEMAPVQIGGGIKMVVNDGKSNMWKNPFGIPYVGIRDLGGEVAISPVIPTIISQVGLNGDITIGKNLDDPNRSIYGKLEMSLNVANPVASRLEAEVRNLSPAAFITAFSDIQLGDELMAMLGTGVDKAKILIDPSKGEFSTEIAVNMLGTTGYFGMGFRQGVFVEGRMDPVLIGSPGFRVLAVTGVNGPTSQPRFKVELSADPKFILQGNIVLLEAMEAKSDIVITKEGFNIDCEGKVFGGALSGKLHATGSNLGSDNPELYGKLELNTDFVGNIANQLRGGLNNKAGSNKNNIAQAHGQLKNPMEQIAQTFSSAFNSVKGLATDVATAGILLLDEYLPRVEKIVFEGELTSSNTMMAFTAIVKIGDERFPVGFKINVKGNLNEIMSLIVDAIMAEVLDRFKDLGNALKDAAEEVGQFFADAYKYAVQFAEDVAVAVDKALDEVDRFWNGNPPPPVRNGGALGTLAVGTRHYEISVTRIYCNSANDGDFLGDAAIELYGTISILPSNMSASPGTNVIGYSVDRGTANNGRNNFPQGASKGVSTGVKHYYARNGTNHGITVSINFLDSEAASNANIKKDAQFRGSKNISLSSLPWNYSDAGQNYDITATGSEGTFTVTVRVVLKKQYGEPDFVNAVRTRNTNEVQRVMRMGGDIRKGCFLGPAIMNRDLNMVNFLMANGAQTCQSDLNTALNPSYFNQQIASKLMLKANLQTAQASLDQVIRLNNPHLLKVVLGKGAKANVNQVTNAVNQNNTAVAEALLTSGGQFNDQNLATAVNNQNVRIASHLLGKGARPNVNLLNTAITKGNVALTTLLLDHQAPDVNTFKLAAQKNDVRYFKLFNSKGYRVNSIEPAQIALNNSNYDILRECFAGGVSSTQVLRLAIQANKRPAIEFCLNYGADGKEAVPYAVTRNDVAFFKTLVEKYSVDPTYSLVTASNANNVALTTQAIQLGGSPNAAIPNKAREGNGQMVKLLVDNGGDPTLAVNGMVTANNTDMVRYLISRGAVTESPADLNKAVELGNLEVTKLLVENGNDPNNAIQRAFSSRNLPIMAYLFEMGASTNGFMPTAAGKGDMEVVRLLLDAGVDPNEGMKPAVDNNKSDVAIYLLNQGASPKGMLKKAAEFGNPKLIRMLLDGGEDPNDGAYTAIAKNHTDAALIILEYQPRLGKLIQPASTNGNDRIVKKLLEMGANPQDGVPYSIQSNKVSTTKILIAAGASVRDGELLKSGVVTGNPSMVQLLLDNEADAKYIDEKGNNFYHQVADMKGRDDIMKLFLNRGIDVNLKNKKGDTPLIICVEVRGKEQLGMVMLLHKAGADLNAKNAKGKTVFKRAKNRQVKKYLKENGAQKK